MRKGLLLAGLFAFGILFAGVAAAQTYTAVIDGTQEVPPVSTTGTGFGCFTLDASNNLSFNITYSNLLGAETAAHIHGPAPVGANAGVVFPLPLGSPKIGVLGPLTAGQVADLNNGLLYVNIHSTMFPSGEIRGQIIAGSCPVSVDENTWGRIKALYVE